MRKSSTRKPKSTEKPASIPIFRSLRSPFLTQKTRTSLFTIAMIPPRSNGFQDFLSFHPDICRQIARDFRTRYITRRKLMKAFPRLGLGRLTVESQSHPQFCGFRPTDDQRSALHAAQSVCYLPGGDSTEDTVALPLESVFHYLRALTLLPGMFPDLFKIQFVSGKLKKKYITLGYNDA